MGRSGSEDPDDGWVRWKRTKGSVIGGIGKEKTARITDAMADLQLGIDGLRGQLSEVGGGGRWSPMDEGDRWTQGLASFARTCSVFLRKTVLGDHGRRETRLLDDRVLGSIELGLDRLRRIPRERRREIEVGLGIAGGGLELTKLDDETLAPGAIHRVGAGPQGVTLSIEWPLPGAADWTGVPSEEAPWPVRPDQLFTGSTDSRPELRRVVGPAGRAVRWEGDLPQEDDPNRGELRGRPFDRCWPTGDHRRRGSLQGRQGSSPTPPELPSPSVESATRTWW